MKRPSTNRILIAGNAALALALAASFFVDLYPSLKPKQAKPPAEQYAWTASAMAEEIPFAQYRNVVRSRTLFSPSQGAKAIPKERILVQDYELLGTFTRGGDTKALLKNISTDQTKTVAIGNWIGHYEIVEITPSGVIFDKAGQAFTLKR